MMEHAERTEFRGQLSLAPESPHAGEQIRNTPEGRLLWAVLDNGIEQYKKNVNATGRRSQRLFREAEAWIRCDNLTWLCSFVNICHVLGFDPEYLRQGLRRWSETQRSPTFQQAA